MIIEFRIWVWSAFVSVGAVGSAPSSWSWAWLGFSDTEGERHGTGPRVAYEELDPDEKFINEAGRIADLPPSQLDVCEQKIVLKLKTSCGRLNNEGIARLAIGLLNCQSDLEGRETYPCDNNTPLVTCTKDMSPEVWNTYHIMTNRARAVCYAARQQHFRASAEMIINKLVDTTRSHLEAIEKFQEKQKSVQGEADFTLEKLSKNQRDVLLSYSKIKSAETFLVQRLTSGVEKMKEANERLLENHELALQLRAEIRHGLDSVARQMEDEIRDRGAEQDKVKAELTELKEIVARIRDTVVETLGQLKKKDDDLNRGYERSFKTVDEINHRLDSILSCVNSAKEVVRSAFKHFERFSGVDGENLNTLLEMTAHGLCMAIAMIFCSFFYVPLFLRWLLILSAILNFSLVHFRQANAGLVGFYGAAIIIALTHRLFIAVRNYNKNYSRTNGMMQKAMTLRRDYTRINDDDSLSKVDAWLTGKYNGDSTFINRNGVNSFTCPVEPLHKQDDDQSVASSLRRREQRHTTPSHSVASSGKTLCASVTRVGAPCRNKAFRGSTYCRSHLR
ncbi:protein brambleberry-like isoform X2 [Cimex lectularius]|uniref:Protein brambleberry n=1 Tax=Cimex lectularius TaxID=79782 RepID=A0A8I6RTG1_CIMLE|nr:protein brambleberry-like isoform X2 [Cimex lectularius]